MIHPLEVLSWKPVRQKNFSLLWLFVLDGAPPPLWIKLEWRRRQELDEEPATESQKTKEREWECILFEKGDP